MREDFGEVELDDCCNDDHFRFEAALPVCEGVVIFVYKTRILRPFKIDTKDLLHAFSNANQDPKGAFLTHESEKSVYNCNEPS
jgi:hypothetical protein